MYFYQQCQANLVKLTSDKPDASQSEIFKVGHEKNETVLQINAP